MKTELDLMIRQAFAILLFRNATLNELRKLSAEAMRKLPAPDPTEPLDEYMIALFTEGTIAYINKTFELLVANGSDTSEDKDYAPLLQIYLPSTEASWLISELDPDFPDLAFGLCDPGVGIPELGSVSILQLLANGACCDHSFKGTYPLSAYASAASVLGGITINEATVQAFAELRG